MPFREARILIFSGPEGLGIDNLRLMIVAAGHSLAGLALLARGEIGC